MAEPVSDGPRVILPANGARHRLEVTPGGAAIVRLSDDSVVGDVSFSLAESNLAIVCISIAEGARGFGAGSEAIRLLLDAASGISTATAVAPPGLGLPVYFWSRMGFRPLFGTGEGRGLRFFRDMG